MLRKDDAIRLRHMLDAASEATDYVVGRTREDLDADRQLAHSLVRCIEIVGEAAGRVSDECRSEHHLIPWTGIIGMRNRLIHAYFDINLTIVWRTVNDEMPSLIAALRCILESEAQD